jgi:glycosyltransferase involved in cell wall biosynthesis
MTDLCREKPLNDRPVPLRCCILLDIRAPWLVEFGTALANTVQTRAFSPVVGVLGRFQRESPSLVQLGPLSVRAFPLQRGYFSRYFGRLVNEDGRVFGRLAESDVDAAQPLICCLPHYARVAERWAGPVVYYATDLFRAYSGWNPKHISSLERRICRASTLVCPNSTRIADVLVEDAGCDPNRIVLVPNAVRRENLLPEATLSPAPFPPDLLDVIRPAAGIIGNLAENTDWVMIEEVVSSTPWLSWVFIGPYSAPIKTPHHADARQRLRGLGGRVRFVGPKNPGELREYARALDVAVLPYRKREPTYSGSSTRFYEHLAACRPILASDGFEELLHKAPLLRITRSARELVGGLEDLRSSGFRDGWEELRWSQSRKETWTERATTMLVELVRQAAQPVSVSDFDRSEPSHST